MSELQMWNESHCISGNDLDAPFLRADANISGVVVIFVFYGVILVAGILGPRLAKLHARKRRAKKQYVELNILESNAHGYKANGVSDKITDDDDGHPQDSSKLKHGQIDTDTTRQDARDEKLNKVEDLILAGRNMGIVVGVFTTAATSLGGGMLNGTAQVVMDPTQGLVWCHTALCYTICLAICPFIFSVEMHRKGYRTMVDPIQNAFGRIQASILCIPSFLSDIFWSASILTALGHTLSVIAGLNFVWAVVISEAVSIIYTFTGGLYSVAYTDVVQLGCIIIPLCIAIPFAMNHPASGSILISNMKTSWLGKWPEGAWISYYIDTALTLVLGGMCWQCYYQRALAQKTVKGVYIISILGSLLTWCMMIPVVLVGAIAYNTDWNMTDYREFGHLPVPSCDYPMALPMVMRFLTPTAVAVISLGAIAAAVMSSTDSAALSTASLVTLHMYSPFRHAVTKSEASSTELQWTMRGAVLVVGVISTTLAIYVPDTYGFLVLAGDMQFLLFPQLVAAIYLPFCNTYGSIVSFVTGLMLRLLSGEPTLHIPAYIKFPYFDQDSGMQLFPFRSFIVMLEMLILVLISSCTRILYERSRKFKLIDRKTFYCFSHSLGDVKAEMDNI